MLAERADARSVLYVEPGQLVVSAEPNLVRTILGSCVAQHDRQRLGLRSGRVGLVDDVDRLTQRRGRIGVRRCTGSSTGPRPP